MLSCVVCLYVCGSLFVASLLLLLMLRSFFVFVFFFWGGGLFLFFVFGFLSGVVLEGGGGWNVAVP